MLSARTWLSQCFAAHTKCKASRSSRDTSFLPTRLIEIGQPEPHKVRLRLSSDRLDASLGYATLSHCWGKAKTLKLTSTSIHNLRTGIAISELGQTFQDAIFTARSLDIRLLWIDSLCIFQDSEVDWQQESARMCQVYSNSVLNIAASIAADTEAGCFPERPSHSLDPCFVQTDWENHENGSYHLLQTSLWDDTMTSMPLAGRAWVVQETLLASRVLYLCGSQMFWQCYDFRACEQFPNGLPSASLVNRNMFAMLERFEYRRSKYSGFRSLSTDLLCEAFGNFSELIPMERRTRGSKYDLWQLWRSIINIYTDCDLTYPSDKLVALSGIAKIMEQVLDDEYCAGLWKSRIATELGWRPLQPLSQNESDTYRAPSWSWACRDGAIEPGYAQKDMISLIDVIQCEVQTATSDRTGAVTGCTLRLSCWLATINFEWSGNDYPFPPTRNFNGKALERYMGPRNIDEPRRFSKLHLLPLTINPDLFQSFRMRFVYLVPAGTTTGQFRRVGYGCFRTPGDLGLSHWKEIAHVKNEDWFEYEEACGDGKYIISII